MTGDGSGDGRRDVTPALVMFPLSVVVCMALALECFRVDLPDIAIGVSGLRGAPPLWITVVSAAIVAVLTLRIVLRGRRGHDVAAWELWVVAGLAVLGLTVALTAIAEAVDAADDVVGGEEDRALHAVDRAPDLTDGWVECRGR